MRYMLNFIMVVLALFLVGCGGGTSGANPDTAVNPPAVDPTPNPTPGTTNPDTGTNPDPTNSGARVGFFIDDPVKGLRYRINGGPLFQTTREGGFRYNSEDDEVEFFLNGISLGKSKCQTRIMPSDIQPTTTAANNVARLLLSLDTNSGTGIDVEDVNTDGITINFNQSSSDFETDPMVSSLITANVGNGSSGTLVSAQDAADHINNSTNQIADLDWDYPVFYMIGDCVWYLDDEVSPILGNQLRQQKEGVRVCPDGVGGVTTREYLWYAANGWNVTFINEDDTAEQQAFAFLFSLDADKRILFDKRVAQLTRPDNHGNRRVRLDLGYFAEGEVALIPESYTTHNLVGTYQAGDYEIVLGSNSVANVTHANGTTYEGSYTVFTNGWYITIQGATENLHVMLSSGTFSDGRVAIVRSNATETDLMQAVALDFVEINSK